MDLLNYQENEATTIAYPLITGTALYNFIDLIFKRHPTKNTTLVDYNIVLIIIPNILFGSTIGSLVNNFIPPIVADSIILPLMIAFSVKFFIRYWNMRRINNLETNISKFSHESDQNEGEDTRKYRETEMTNRVKVELLNKERECEKTSKTENENELSVIHEEACNSIKLAEREKYESTMHIPHILATICIFLVFETLSFLAQGKIISFSICSHFYLIGISTLTIVYISLNFTIFFYTKNKINEYKQIGYSYTPKISTPKYYLLMCFGSFIGGFNSGVFGIGNSTCVIFTLLFLDLEPAIVSATVGYQVVFAGSASLVQAIATQKIQSDVALLFFLVTFAIGGTLSFFLKRLVSKFNQQKINQILLLVVFGLVTSSSVALIVSMVMGYLQFGASNMQDVPFSCP